MHRSYQPTVPSANKVLKQRWDQDIFSWHRNRVQTAKCVINDSQPKKHAHLDVKLKKIQLELERLSIIKHDDRLLQDKIDHIQKFGGYVDHIKRDYIKKSLNHDKKYRELIRVADENRKLLKRICKRQSNYSMKQWNEDFKENVHFMYAISRYPPHLWGEDDVCSTKESKVTTANGNKTEESKSTGKNETKDEAKPEGEKSKNSDSKEKNDNATQGSLADVPPTEAQELTLSAGQNHTNSATLELYVNVVKLPAVQLPQRAGENDSQKAWAEEGAQDTRTRRMLQLRINTRKMEVITAEMDGNNNEGTVNTSNIESNTIEMKANTPKMDSNTMEQKSDTSDMQGNAMETEDNTTDMKDNATGMDGNITGMKGNKTDIEGKTTEMKVIISEKRSSSVRDHVTQSLLPDTRVKSSHK